MSSQWERGCKTLATVAFLVAIPFVIFGIWYWMSAMEAAAFNRATGKNVSAFDAMWIELRVQESAK